jgi:hypothetical protein
MSWWWSGGLSHHHVLFTTLQDSPVFGFISDRCDGLARLARHVRPLRFLTSCRGGFFVRHVNASKIVWDPTRPRPIGRNNTFRGHNEVKSRANSFNFNYLGRISDDLQEECGYLGGWGTMFAWRAKSVAERNTFAPIFEYDKSILPQLSWQTSQRLQAAS